MTSIVTLLSIIEYLFSRDKKIELKERLHNIGYLFLLFLGADYTLSLLPNYTYLIPNHYRIKNPFLYVFLFLLVSDILYYAYHKLQHHWSLLWKIHRLHHSGNQTNATTSFRTNIFDGILQYFIILYPTLAIVGFHDTAYIYTYYIFIFFLIFAHLDLNLGIGFLTKIFVSPKIHRIHHQRDGMKYNFAQVFSFIDIFGKTYNQNTEKLN